MNDICIFFFFSRIKRIQENKVVTAYWMHKVKKKIKEPVRERGLLHLI